MTVLLRTGTESDLVAVGGLHQRSRVASYAHLVPVEILAARTAASFGAWWSERWIWERDTHRLTVAEVDGEPAGFTYVGPSETAGAVELYAIHVDPARVGTGIGRELMRHARDDLAAIGGDRAVLWVLTGNDRARRFYERDGWQPDGATRVEAVNDVPVYQVRYTLPADSSRRT